MNDDRMGIGDRIFFTALFAAVAYMCWHLGYRDAKLPRDADLRVMSSLIMSASAMCSLAAAIGRLYRMLP